MDTMKVQAVLNIPAREGWNVFMSANALSKVNPNVIESFKFIQGDGSPGTLCMFKSGPAMQPLMRESVQKVETIVSDRSVTYLIISGGLKNMYDPCRVTFSFFPVSGNEGEQCIAERKIEYKKINPTMPTPEKVKDFGLQYLKNVETFVINNLVAN